MMKFALFAAVLLAGACATGASAGGAGAGQPIVLGKDMRSLRQRWVRRGR